MFNNEIDENPDEKTEWYIEVTDRAEEIELIW
jgi:hypothetical protein